MIREDKMKNHNIANILLQESLDKAIKQYGLEGTEEVIKRVYSSIPKLRDHMLTAFWKRIKNE